MTASDLGAFWLLPRIGGPADAADRFTTGRMVGADEARRMRLVDRVVPADTLIDRALALAAAITRNFPTGVRLYPGIAVPSAILAFGGGAVPTCRPAVGVHRADDRRRARVGNVPREGRRHGSRRNCIQPDAAARPIDGRGHCHGMHGGSCHRGWHEIRGSRPHPRGEQ
jgi:hypothetical protein